MPGAQSRGSRRTEGEEAVCETQRWKCTLGKTLAVKTGEIRGAVKGRTALARSCAGQQNLPSKGVSVSIRIDYGEFYGNALAFFWH